MKAVVRPAAAAVIGPFAAQYVSVLAYTRIIVPRLPGLQRVPDLWWIALLLPMIVILFALGTQIRHPIDFFGMLVLSVLATVAGGLFAMPGRGVDSRAPAGIIVFVAMHSVLLVLGWGARRLAIGVVTSNKA